jgi:NAD(P) transhydrogenase
MFAAVGVQVTWSSGATGPLEFLDREIVDELMHQMRQRNVTFRLGESVESLGRHGGARRRARCSPRVRQAARGRRVLFSAGRSRRRTA